IGGVLSDKIGPYKVMTTSLLLTGSCLFGMMFLEGLVEIGIGILITMMVADTFRPALFASIRSYSKPENTTRSISLIRLAINLWFSFGPAIGGLIITSYGYSGLFIVDAITCALAGVGLLMWLSPKRRNITKEPEPPDGDGKAIADGWYVLFLIGMLIFGFVFLQWFSTIPVFFEKIVSMSEAEIGLLMALNGGLIVVLEMPIVSWLDSIKANKLVLTAIGLFLTGLSILVFNWSVLLGMLLASIVFMTVGEMIAFPYSNAWVMDRAKRGKLGDYMGWYTVAFSLSHIFGHFTGLKLSDHYGFEVTWYAMFGLSVIGALLIFLVAFKEKKGKTG
ncbi:MAG: MFS transporter, partial [Bacteroidota bacterium]